MSCVLLTSLRFVSSEEAVGTLAQPGRLRLCISVCHPVIVYGESCVSGGCPAQQTLTCGHSGMRTHACMSRELGSIVLAFGQHSDGQIKNPGLGFRVSCQVRVKPPGSHCPGHIPVQEVCILLGAAPACAMPPAPHQGLPC